MKGLTCHQRDALLRIRVVRDMQVKRLWQAITENEHMRGGRPSEWVFEATLTQAHRVNRAHINSLVAKGYLERRPTDGGGPQVRIVGEQP